MAHVAPNENQNQRHMKRVTSHGSKRLTVTTHELISIEVYASAILKNAKKLRESRGGLMDDLYLEMMFNRSQAVADYAKAASKRLGGKPRRDDFLDLVERASQTVDMT